MTSRIVLAAAMLMSVGAGSVFAAPNQQALSIPVAQDVRSPSAGDPAARAVNPHWTPQQWVRADRQGPGTANGNQPDRAEAGAGAR